MKVELNLYGGGRVFLEPTDVREIRDLPKDSKNAKRCRVVTYRDQYVVIQDAVTVNQCIEEAKLKNKEKKGR